MIYRKRKAPWTTPRTSRHRRKTMSVHFHQSNCTFVILCCLHCNWTLSLRLLKFFTKLRSMSSIICFFKHFSECDSKTLTLIETQQKLTETLQKLAETQQKLAETQQKQTERQEKLEMRQEKLFETQQKLAEQQLKINELQLKKLQKENE